MSAQSKAVLIAIAAAVFGFIGLSILADWWAEYLWLETLGYESVFWTIRTLKVGLFLTVFIPVFLYFWINFRLLAARLDLTALADYLMDRSGPSAPFEAFIGVTGRRRPGGAGAGGGTPPALVLAAAVVAFAFGLLLYGQWDTLLRYHWSQPYGDADPIFGHDIGFYLFELPFLELQQNGLVAVTLLATAAVGFVYVFAGAFRLTRGRRIDVPPRIFWHVAVNLALFLVAVSWGYYLDRFALLQSADGAVYGAGFTDVHVARPALWIAIGATLALAAAVMVRRLFASADMALIVAAGYLGVVFVCLAVVPWGVQKFVVEPNELERETPYLTHNIAFTRKAYGLARVEELAYGGVGGLTPAALERNRQTIDNIRLWDWRPLSQTFRQLQQIRTYYQFNDVDVDRYWVDGAYRQVMLSARELSAQLPGKSETWLNRRLQYTHGYGAAMSLTAEMGEQGGPVLLIKDLPPKTSGGLTVTEPAIYYGEDASGYRIVSTSVKELDFPKGDENVYTTYGGHGGVRLDTFWKRILFAWHQADIGILLTTYVSPRTRIQFWRPVQDRIERIAPFLRLDDDPYLVLSEGRFFWIQDAYTEADTFPYSEPYGDRFNYIRNSLKVVIDAFDGGVTFYVVDPVDPVLKVYRQALPALFRPFDDMPEDLKNHLRYPQDLFEAQVAKYNTYHMTVPQVFYNGEDVWANPQEKYGGQQIEVVPYYVLIKLPGEERLQFLLMTPLTPNSRDNMIAWMAARSDFPGYGQLIVYKLPKERLILGPIQIEAKIDQDTVISQQLSLWDQRGSRVIRGNLLVVPIEQSFVYVEPVYLIAEGTNIPQLKRVIVSDGERIAMESTLLDALAAVFGERRRRPAEAPDADETRRQEDVTEMMKRAEDALRGGDWDAFGRAMQALKGLLGQ